MEDVFKLLEANEEGLNSAEVERRLGLFGPNKLEAKDVNPILQVCLNFSCACTRINPTLSSHSASFLLVPFFHVESAFLGYGGCCSCRHCAFQWWRPRT